MPAGSSYRHAQRFFEQQNFAVDIDCDFLGKIVSRALGPHIPNIDFIGHTIPQDALTEGKTHPFAILLDGLNESCWAKFQYSERKILLRSSVPVPANVPDNLKKTTRRVSRLFAGQGNSRAGRAFAEHRR